MMKKRLILLSLFFLIAGCSKAGQNNKDANPDDGGSSEVDPPDLPPGGDGVASVS